MIQPTRIDPGRARLYRETGAWAGETLSGRFSRSARANPSAIALIDERQFTFEELDALSSSFAAALRERGIGPGDVVSAQLPNWWEAAVVLLGASRIGAVLNPLQMIYRQGELRFILRQNASKALIVPHAFRGFGYGAMVDEVAAVLPDAPLVITVRGPGATRFEDLLKAPAGEPPTVSPDDVCLLLYTSGTTADPKGALHTHNSLMRSAQDLVDLFRIHGGDRVFMASPVTHITGLLLGFLMPWSQGAGAVLMDQWDAERALDLILDHGCTFTGGAPPFIRGLIDAAKRRGLGPEDVPLTRGPCGGADVPPSLIREAADVLGARFTRIYGSTEGVTVTGAQADQPFAFAAESDGPPLPGHEIRIVDEAGRDVAPGTTGEILIRGPSNFVGYFDPALNADCFDEQGFFRMGDLGQWDADGCIRIQGRKKDIIIRNGENIAAKEVEDLLVTHEMVGEVALVGVPDPDTGERACAYVVPAQGAVPTLADLCGALETAQIARQKYPEYLVLVDALPKTASGKVQKFRLRDDARSRGLTWARS